MENIRPQLLEDIYQNEIDQTSSQEVPPKVTKYQLQEDIGGEFEQPLPSKPLFPDREKD